MSLTNTAPFAVYVHWPFCLSKCPYCDFNSHVRHGGYDEARYVRAVEAELAFNAARTPGRTVSTVFFGGGTPSLMQPSSVATILDAIGKHWGVTPDIEVTLEANPTSVEATRFRGYRSAGVNRVSLGVQALNDADLKELGRLHTRARGARCGRRRALDLRPLLVRSHLRAAAADTRSMGQRTQARHRRSGRTSLALSAHHRTGDAVPCAAQGRQADRSRRGSRPRALRHDTGSLRTCGSSRL